MLPKTWTSSVIFLLRSLRFLLFNTFPESVSI